nr:unnamed protein product [Spirometra erinaceieuropaei]
MSLACIAVLISLLFNRHIAAVPTPTGRADEMIFSRKSQYLPSGEMDYLLPEAQRYLRELQIARKIKESGEREKRFFCNPMGYATVHGNKRARQRDASDGGGGGGGGGGGNV